MRALGVARRDARRIQYDAIGAALSLPLPRGVPADPSLRLLFRPRGDESGDAGQVADIRNIAPGLSTVTAPAFYRRVNNSPATHPPISRDNYGPYWNFTSTSQRFGATYANSAIIPWQTSGGHLPATIAAVFMLTTATTGEQYLFFIGGNTGSSCGIGIGFAAGSVVTGKIFTRTSQNVSTSAITLNQPYAAIFTSRTTTNHEVVCRNLVTGAVLSNTSASDSGAAAGLPIAITFGSQANLVAFLDRARIYMTAFWDRAFSADELRAWVAAPMSIMQPRTPAMRFIGDDGFMRRPRGGIIPGSLVL